ncbi:hypothetical protein U9M48_009749 [Paspalum notatum var. saurae]|uniref:Uncharacterized protein n=1 Tax=Paspalum notatum var. saurae TaxID=547442 RepID=A0AAQ3WF99_PASNO
MAAILSADGVVDEAKEAVVASLIAVQVRAEGIPLLTAPLLSQSRSLWMHEIFHIISKAALWIVLAVLWFIVIVLKIVINFFALLKSALGSLSSNQENSLKTGLIRRNHGNRTGDRKSSNV